MEEVEKAAGAILSVPPGAMGGGVKQPLKVVDEPGGGWDDPRALVDRVLLAPPIYGCRKNP